MITGGHRVLVLGGTGMLGHEVVRTFEAGPFELHIAVRDPERARRARLRGTLHPFDANADPVGSLLSKVRPNVVINCIGLIKQLPEGSRPVTAIRINALFPHEVAEACADVGSRFIQVSTDCVFSGRLAAPQAYRETDTPDAEDVYGRTKLVGEVTDGSALTLRTSIIGWELDRVTGLLEWFAAQAGGSVAGFTNAIFSGLTTRAFAGILRRLVEEHDGLTGLYHVSSEPIDKYSLLVMLKEALEMECEIKPEDDVRINRALDSSLFRSKTNIAVPSWAQMLDEYAPARARYAST